MIQFIEKEDFTLPTELLDFLRTRKDFNTPYMLHLEKRKERVLKLITEQLDLDGKDSMMHMKIARQKLSAIETALQQLKGE